MTPDSDRRIIALTGAENTHMTETPYQLFDPLTDEEFAALKEDIAEHGILVPVEVDEDGSLLDGHHRARAWGELTAEGRVTGDYPTIVRSGMTEQEKRIHVRKLNLLRRQLTREQKQAHAAAMRADGVTRKPSPAHWALASAQSIPGVSFSVLKMRR